jgi:hypothetical protein
LIGYSTPIHTTHIWVLLDNELINYEGNSNVQDHDKREENVPSDEYYDDDNEPAHLYPEAPSDDVLSVITDVHNQEMMEQNWLVLEHLFEPQAEREEERTRMCAVLDRGWPAKRNGTTEPTELTIMKMVDTVLYYWGAMDVDEFLGCLRWNFDSDKNCFLKRGTDRGKYAISIHDTLNHHTHGSQRQTGNPDPSEWVSDL